MAPSTVVHILSDDTAPHQHWRLRLLLRDQVNFRVVQIGRARAFSTFHVEHIPVRSAFFSLIPRALRNAIAGAGVVHFWSTQALRRLTPLMAARRGQRLIAEFSSFGELERRVPLVALDAHCVVPAHAVAAEVARYGIAAKQCSVIAPAVDEEFLNARPRDALREKLGIAPHELAILTSPGLYRDLAAKRLCWAVLIAGQLNGRLCLLSAPDAAGDAVLRNFARGSRCEALVRTGPRSEVWPEALRAADLYVSAPRPDEPADPAIWAAAADIPVVASGSPATRELLSAREGVDIYDAASSPRVLAGRVLRAIEQSPGAIEIKRGAGSKKEEFHGQTLRRAYATVYDEARV